MVLTRKLTFLGNQNSDDLENVLHKNRVAELVVEEAHLLRSRQRAVHPLQTPLGLGLIHASLTIKIHAYTVAWRNLVSIAKQRFFFELQLHQVVPTRAVKTAHAVERREPAMEQLRKNAVEANVPRWGILWYPLKPYAHLYTPSQSPTQGYTATSNASKIKWDKSIDTDEGCIDTELQLA